MENHTDRPTLFGHPKGLFYLFFAEMWERFSFYGMRALLVLYMTKQLIFTDEISYGVYAAYMSLVYFTPLIGGLVADQYLGYRKSIVLGGILMALGHFFLAIEHPVFFYGSLALLIVGNGFFKPNISTFVGTLYDEDDERRDAGFTIFYMGINIGGFLAPLLCAWVAGLWGWHYGFALAGIGMLAGLFTFTRGLKTDTFGEEGLPPKNAQLNRKFAGLKREQIIYFISIASIPVFALFVKYNYIEQYIVWVATIFITGAMIYIYRSVSGKAKTRLLVTAYFTILMSLFWAIFEQAGSSLTLFADRNVALIGMNAAQTNSINSFFIIILAIPFSWLWTKLSAVKMNPNSAVKAALGLVLLGVGFLVFAMGGRSVDEFARTPMFYLVFGYFILTVGELLISPIGLSKMTELAPAKYLAFIMGVFFASSFYGHFFAGKIAKLTAVKGDANYFASGWFGDLTHLISGLDPTLSDMQGDAFQQLYSYASVYAGFGAITLAIGVLALLISPAIKKWMAGVH